MRSFVAAAIFLGVLGTAGTASAHCRLTTCDESNPDCERSRLKASKDCVSEGVLLYWETTTIPYRISAQGSSKLSKDKIQKAVRAAADAWQYADCADGRTSLRFEERDPIREEKPIGLGGAEAEKEGVEPFGIYFRDDEWAKDGDDSLAFTSHAFGTVRRPGLISYADIEVNTFNRDWTVDDDAESGGPSDLQTVMTHEFGHYIGLAHSLIPESIMVPRYCDGEGAVERCETHGTVGKRALAKDDIDAVCLIYPHNMPAKLPETTAEIQSATGGATAGCSSVGGSASSALTPLLASLLPLAAMVRRRRRSLHR